MKTIGTLIFPDFELLDVFGPLEMFGLLPDHFDIRMVASSSEPVASKAGPKSLVDVVIGDDVSFDILLVPGGPGTRVAVDDTALLAWIARASHHADLVSSVCTGSALLARAGVLDGVRATTNKAAYKWVTGQSDKALWQPQARWVEDGKIFTSSGVSAGIDMSLAVIARLLGVKKAEQTANFAEYDWHRDPNWDPFADLYGLIGASANKKEEL